jgi:hypothetical protein
MNFDLGNVLTRALQITWKHKVLWLLHALPMLLSFAVFPLFMIPVFFLDERGGLNMPGAWALTFTIGLSVLSLIVIIAAFMLNVFIMSATTLGVIRAEQGTGSLALRDLLTDCRQYFGRILGVMAIISLTIGLVFFVFFMLAFVLILVTMGMAAICLQPVLIIISPLSFLMIGMLEAALTAVVTEDMHAVEAVKRGWKIVKENIWKYIVLTIIIYFGSSILMGVLIFPIMLPFFSLSFFIASAASSSPEHFDPRIMGAVSLGFMCLFVPVMAALQGVITTFMKSALDITYLRLTASQKDIPTLIPANA